MARRRTIPRYRGLDVLFWGLLLFAVAVGGSNALAGLPILGRLLLPQGIPSASAGRDPAAVAKFDRALEGKGPYTTQVLQPVQDHPAPEWLTARRALGPATPPRATAPGRVPKIAIVIDDMGGEVVQSRRAIDLPKAISLSFLPYPETAPALARAALREGHEVLVHVPMEPYGTSDPGPNALRSDLDAAENLRRLSWDFSRLTGFDGINNHEGSRFTADRGALVPIMGALADRGLFFLDSRTSPNTQVVATARAFGVASAGRDIFLDDTDRPDLIDAQLRQTERVAQLQGIAIAIGHPRVNTLDALWRWTGELASRGYALVPVRVAVRLKTEREIREASLAAARH
jgi:polysaccharide deacetylase 2 family uncharacterized protein YibQ